MFDFLYFLPFLPDATASLGLLLQHARAHFIFCCPPRRTVRSRLCSYVRFLSRKALATSLPVCGSKLTACLVGYYITSGNAQEIFLARAKPQECMQRCDATESCQTFIVETIGFPEVTTGFCLAESFSPARDEIFGPFNQPYSGSSFYLALAYRRSVHLCSRQVLMADAAYRSDSVIPARSDLPATCVVCKTETCLLVAFLPSSSNRY